MDRNSFLVLFIAGALAPAGTRAAESPAAAQARTPAMRAERNVAMEQMMRADVDKDGRVTRDEIERFDRRLVRRFKAADANGDGKLDLQEFERLRALSKGATRGTAASDSARR